MDHLSPSLNTNSRLDINDLEELKIGSQNSNRRPSLNNKSLA